MTIQVPETLLVSGQKINMHTCPLTNYFQLTERFFEFQAPRSTMLYRGYVGTWELIDQRLYLKNIISFGNPVTLQDIFKNCGEMVLAHWLSMNTLASFGKRKYEDSLREFVANYKLELKFNKGVLIGAKLTDNFAGLIEENFSRILEMIHTKANDQ